MKTLLTLVLTILLIAPISAQESEMLQKEIKALHGQINALQNADVPKSDLDQNIRKAHMNELQLKKDWKQKELALAHTTSGEKDAAVSGLLGEAKALKDRYRAAMETRMDLEKEKRAKMAERADETAGPSMKLQMRMDKLRGEIDAKKALMKREAMSETPDAERLATLEGQIEALYRQLEALDER